MALLIVPDGSFYPTMHSQEGDHQILNHRKMEGNVLFPTRELSFRKELEQSTKKYPPVKLLSSLVGG